MSIGIASFQSTKVFKSLQNQISESATRLTTGKKINSAQDNAAGLAIVSRLEAISKELDVGIRNASDAVSVVQTAGGAVAGVESGLQRLRELSIQSANGILADSDRKIITAEAEQIKAEIGRVMSSTEFNGKKILSEDQTFNIQTGGGVDNQINFSINSIDAQIKGAGLADIDLNTKNSAMDAIGSIDAMLDITIAARSEYGAINNRFESVIENLSTRKVSVKASKSRFEDADIAKEAAKLSRSQLLEDVNIAMQVQANANAGSVLALLKT